MPMPVGHRFWFDGEWWEVHKVLSDDNYVIISDWDRGTRFRIVTEQEIRP